MSGQQLTRLHRVPYLEKHLGNSRLYYISQQVWTRALTPLPVHVISHPVKGGAHTRATITCHSRPLPFPNTWVLLNVPVPIAADFKCSVLKHANTHRICSMSWPSSEVHRITMGWALPLLGRHPRALKAGARTDTCTPGFM